MGGLPSPDERKVDTWLILLVLHPIPRIRKTNVAISAYIPSWSRELEPQQLRERPTAIPKGLSGHRAQA